MNFVTSIVDAAPADRVALIELRSDGSRRTWSFAAVADRSARLGGTLAAQGVRPGDTVMTVVGSRSEWVFAMLACFRMGAVALACNEQLRTGDLRLRLKATQPAVVVVDERNRSEVEAAKPQCPVVTVTDERVFDGPPCPAVEVGPDVACLLTFTSGSTGEPKGVVHVHRYLHAQALQAEHWMGATAGDIVWCTAASGWSKSARNAFIAPWLRGATAFLHDARFAREERLELIEEEGVDVLCMSPTEYRFLTKHGTLPRFRKLREVVSAGEPLNPEVLRAWHDATGLWIRDGYGQTETGQITANPPATVPRPGSMGRALPGVRAWIDDGELVVEPATVPTFFRGYLGHEPVPRDRPWRTGDRVHQDEDGYFYFEGRDDDIIISSGYRIGPFEVESALLTHAAVAEAAAVAAPHAERGSVVRAIVVLRAPYVPSAALVRELQEHVKLETSPYKYPRMIEFAKQLPRTVSGKLNRAAIRRADSAEPAA